MTDRKRCKRLQVAPVLYDFVEQEALPGTGVSSEAFWSGLDELVYELGPKNRALLQERDRLQAKMDEWYRQNPGPIKNQAAYQAYLREIGYLQDAPEQVTVNTSNLDVEFTQQAGPQLVVPITNARYALNAANARWGSLYDALYGTDAIPEDGGATRAGGYNPVRGAKVIEYARRFLDQSLPLAQGSHSDATKYSVEGKQLKVQLAGGASTTLADAGALLGYRGQADEPEALVFRHHGLHIEIHVDKTHPIGQQDGAGVKDVLLESA